MSDAVRWHPFSGSALVCVLLATLQGCETHKDVPGVKWDSPKMREIKNEWQSLWDTLAKSPEKVEGNFGKEKYLTVQSQVEHLFTGRLSKQDLRQLATSSDMLPARAEDRTRFVNDALALLVKTLVKSRDRECLVELLSKRCPSRLDVYENIEYGLVFWGEYKLTLWGKRLEDPILILGEAYAKCQEPETRRILAAAVRRAFVGMGISGKDDAQYVANAMQWYESHKGHLKVNDRYPHNEGAGAIPIERFEKHPEFYENPPEGTQTLFIEKR